MLNVAGSRGSKQPSIYTDEWMILVAVLKQTNPDAGKVDKYPTEIPDAKAEFYKEGKRYSLVASWNHGWTGGTPCVAGERQA